MPGADNLPLRDVVGDIEAGLVVPRRRCLRQRTRSRDLPQLGNQLKTRGDQPAEVVDAKLAFRVEQRPCFEERDRHHVHRGSCGLDLEEHGIEGRQP